MVFGLGGDKEEEAGISRGRQGSPAEEVRRLASQGLSEQEIIRELKERDYSNTQINRALNKVLKFRVSGSRGEAAETAPARGGAEREGEERFIAPPPGRGGEEREERRPSPSPFEEFTREEEPVWEMSEEEEIELEELIEEIIDERWMGVESRLSKFEKEREVIRNELEGMKEKIQNLEEKHEEEKEKLEDKVDRTFSHIETIESRVGSVEKAFKEFLPSLTENVRSLSGIVKELKGQTGATTSTAQPSVPSSNIPGSPEDYIKDLESSEKKGEDKEKGPSALEE